jgi:vacuolar iron transporter family protein
MESNPAGHTHPEKHLSSSHVIKDVVIGMSDGLTVPFALAAGLSSVAAISTSLIVLAGLAEITAGSIAMGLGGYLAGRTEMDFYDSELRREYEEVDNLPEEEKREVQHFFLELGLSEDIQLRAAEEITRDKKKWVEFMMKYELNLEKPNPKRARNSALNIGLSYIVGGMVPLSPYFFFTAPVAALRVSVIVTLVCLFIFGYYKSKVTGVAPWGGALRVTLIGAAAAAAAFFVAGLFK